MVFIKNIFFLCCLLILLTIVMPINCNKFNLKINQSRYKRFPRQVNANNNQQIGVNNNVLSKRNNIFGSTLQLGFEAFNRGVKDVMHHMSGGRVIFPGHTDERKGRQLNSNIYSQAQDGSNYNYNIQDYRSQPWYVANRDYYDKYYEDYYRNYYQTTTSPPPSPSPIIHQYQQPLPTHISQSNPQTVPNRSNNPNALLPESNQNEGQQAVYIDENGLFQIGKSGTTNVVNSVSLVDDDAIVFQSDESQFNDGRTRLFNSNHDKQSEKTNSNTKSSYHDGLPIFSN